MNNKESEWQIEQKHFADCKAIIQKNILRYQSGYEELLEQSVLLHREVNSGNEELYDRLMTVNSLAEQAAASLRKNQSALEKPYFGRIDYKEGKSPQTEQVYIGKHGIFKNRTEVVIADWRAPISTVYYENEIGPGEYRLPDETTIPVDLLLKRTYDTADGELRGYYDSDVASNDELLVKYLSRNKDVVLGEIIATIQKEQNAIIRESPFSNLIVQGVAGSGKTTVAMHRISYLLYNYKERFESNEFCIIGSNDLLLNYITSGLPELDVPNIKHMRMDELLIRLCEKDWKKSLRVIPPDASAKYRCTFPFMKYLEWFLMKKREEIVDCSALSDKRIGTILSAANNMTLLREHPEFSIARMLNTLDERVKTRIRFLMSGCDRDEIQRMLKHYAGHYKNRMPKVSVTALYQEFLEGWTNQTAPTLPAEQADALRRHLASCSCGQYDLYDIAALSLIHYRITQKQPNEEFGLLFLDEAQDFGLSVFYTLRTLLPAAYFTIMGDVSQNINYDTGINDWYELNRFLLTGPKDKFLLLQKSYRNTIEISEFAGKILDAASFGRYRITPVIRHGQPVVEENFWSEDEMADRLEALLPAISEKGYSTTAIICMSEKEAAACRSLLENRVTLADGEASNYSAGVMILPIRLVKGLEFDTVVLWNPRIQQNIKRPDTAKLLYVASTRALHELYIFNC